MKRLKMLNDGCVFTFSRYVFVYSNHKVTRDKILTIIDETTACQSTIWPWTWVCLSPLDLASLCLYFHDVGREIMRSCWGLLEDNSVCHGNSRHTLSLQTTGHLPPSFPVCLSAPVPVYLPDRRSVCCLLTGWLSLLRWQIYWLPPTCAPTPSSERSWALTQDVSVSLAALSCPFIFLRLLLLNSRKNRQGSICP